jgi:hypothetical protein
MAEVFKAKERKKVKRKIKTKWQSGIQFQLSTMQISSQKWESRSNHTVRQRGVLQQDSLTG